MTATATATGLAARITMPHDRNLAACAAEPYNASTRFQGMTRAKVEFSPDGRRAFVTSTDGRCLTRAFADASCDADAQRLTHYVDAPSLRRGNIPTRGKGPTVVSIRDGQVARPAPKGGETVTACATEAELSASPFPPTADLWNNPSDIFDPSTKTVTFNAELLAKMAEAIGRGGCVTLYITSPKKAITVIGDNGVGLIMPATREVESDRTRYIEAFPNSTWRKG